MVMEWLLVASVKTFTQIKSRWRRRRPMAAILDVRKIWKSKIIALDRMKTHTKFQIDWSDCLKVIAIKKNPTWPPACNRHLGFLNISTCMLIDHGSEVDHQISKGSVKQFTSYGNSKNHRRRHGAQSTVNWVRCHTARILVYRDYIKASSFIHFLMLFTYLLTYLFTGCTKQYIWVICTCWLHKPRHFSKIF
jgi:hypothetical protein